MLMSKDTIMKSSLLLLSAVLITIMTSGCTISRSVYSPGYNNSDYVYSVGYYGYRPYWGNRYYTGVGWGNHYWHGNRSLFGGYYGPGWW